MAAYERDFDGPAILYYPILFHPTLYTPHPSHPDRVKVRVPRFTPGNAAAAAPAAAAQLLSKSLTSKPIATCIRPASRRSLHYSLPPRSGASPQFCLVALQPIPLF